MISATSNAPPALQQCTCFAPESMGAITVPASLLVDYVPSSSSATVTLTRSVISTFVTQTTTVYLIGQASINCTASVQ
jgi:hypothetical protein